MARGAFPLQQPNAQNRYTEEQTKRDFEEASRRVQFKNAAASRLLLKPTNQIQHGGGEQVQRGSREFQALVNWINGAALKERMKPVAAVNGEAASGGLDRAFFVDYVQPILTRRCALPAWHGGSNSVAGKIFHIFPAQPDGQMLADHTEANWKAVLSQNRAALKKDTSKLLTKPTGKVTHGGGAQLDPNKPDQKKDLDLITAWINGAVSTNARPVASIALASEIPLGTAVTLDGSSSHDADGGKLTYAWEITAKPTHAPMPALQPQGMWAQFAAHAPGVYTVSLVVNDGKIDSSPAFVNVVVVSDAEDPQQSGSPVLTPFQPDASPTSQFVRRVYLDVLGRPPALEELHRAVQQTREKLVSRLFNSLEYDRAWYEEQLSYLFLTGSYRPDAEELVSLPIHLFNREVAQVQALQMLVASPAFQARNPGATNYVMAAYEQLLGTLPNVQHVQFGVSLVEAHKELELVQRVMNTPELAGRAYQLWAHRLFRKYLGANCPEELVEKIAARLGQFPLAGRATEKELVLSQEYLNNLGTPRPKTPAMLAQSLYRDLLKRAPMPSEFEAARVALMSASDLIPVLSVLAEMLLKSAEARVPEKVA